MNDLAGAQPKAPWFKAVLFAGMLLFAFYASTHMVAAGDTWVALACGRHFDNHGVDTVEPFSFNSHPAGPSDEQLEKFPQWTHGLIRTLHPTGWINQNWLTHLGFYKLAVWFGSDGSYNLNALVYWKFAIYILTVFCVYGIGKVLGAGDTLSAAAACLAMLVGRSFYDIRPAGYSNLLVPAFVLLLALTMCRNYRWIWLTVPLIIFWANVHGGYIYAFIMFVPFAGINLLLRVDRRWTLSLGLCGLWLLMLLMSRQFVTHEYYIMVQRIYHPAFEAPGLMSDKLLYVCLVLAAGSLLLAGLKKIPTGVFYAYHYFVSAVLFISLLVRFMPRHPSNLTPQFESMYSYLIASSLCSFMMVFAAGLPLLSAMTFKKEAFLYLPTKGLIHVIGAGAASLVAMIVFNPFHLTNITHTFEISVSKHAESWRLVNEWKPAFDWMDKTTDTANPVGDEEWFAALCLLTAAVIGIWLVSYFLRPLPQGANRKKTRQPAVETDAAVNWPKIDLPVIIIGLLTIYMAVRSRRFIPLAGAAAGPVLAMMIVQTWQMLTTRLASNTVTLPAMAQNGIRVGITAVFLGLAALWGNTYKHIYLDPWPRDHQYNSVFMRMTDSQMKPIDACQFIRDNHLSGHLFNYWTEGGAVAFGQTPDPKTGHIPLKLFMDGRAQAAYNHDTFKQWQLIFSGGPVALEALRQKREPTDAELAEIGHWITDEIGPDVWVTLMPKTQANSTFMKALKKTGDWKTVYLDDYQQMLVNIKTEPGRALLEEVVSGQALFPGPSAKGLSMYAAIVESHAAQYYPQLYSLLSQALKEFPTPSTMLIFTQLQASAQFKPQVLKDMAAYLDDFSKNRETYRRQDGYRERLDSAWIAADCLGRELPDKKVQYQALLESVKLELNASIKYIKW